MRIVVVNSMSVEDFSLSTLQMMKKPDLIVFGFGVTGDVNFELEIHEQSKVFAELVLLSGNLNCTVIAAMDTVIYGYRYKSAAVIDNGKIVDISDMVHGLDRDYRPGRGFRVYDTTAGKIGVIVHTDILFPESARILALCDSDILVTLTDKDCPYDHMMMARSASLANGVVNVCSSEGRSYICDNSGRVSKNSSHKVLTASVDIAKSTELLEVRRKDKYREIFTNFL